MQPKAAHLTEVGIGTGGVFTNKASLRAFFRSRCCSFLFFASAIANLWTHDDDDEEVVVEEDMARLVATTLEEDEWLVTTIINGGDFDDDDAVLVVSRSVGVEFIMVRLFGRVGCRN